MMLSLALVALMQEQQAPQMPAVVEDLQRAVHERDWDAATRHLDQLVAEGREWLVSGEPDYATCYAMLRADYERAVAMPQWAVLFGCEEADYDRDAERFTARGNWGSTYLFMWRENAQERVTSVPVSAPFRLELQIPGTPWNFAPRVILMESEAAWDWNAEKPSLRGPRFETGYREARFDGEPQAGGWFGPDNLPLAEVGPSRHRCFDAMQLIVEAGPEELRAEVVGDRSWTAPHRSGRPTELLLEVARATSASEVEFLLETQLPREIFDAQVGERRDDRFRSWAQSEDRQTGLPGWLKESWIESGDWASPFYGSGGFGGRASTSRNSSFRYPSLPDIESDVVDAARELQRDVEKLWAEEQSALALERVSAAASSGKIPAVWTSALQLRIHFLNRQFDQARLAADRVLEDAPYHWWTHLMLAELELRRDPRGAAWLTHLQSAISGARLADRYAAVMYAHRLADRERALTFGIRAVTTWNSGLKLDRTLPRNLMEGPTTSAGVSRHAKHLSWTSYRGEQPDAALLLQIDAWTSALEQQYGPISERLRVVQFTQERTLERYMSARDTGYHRFGRAGFHSGMNQILIAGEVAESDFGDLESVITQAWLNRRYATAPAWFREAMRQRVATERRHLCELARNDERALTAVLRDPTILALTASVLEDRAALPAAFLEWLSEQGEEQRGFHDQLLASFGAPGNLESGRGAEVPEDQIRAWEPKFRIWLDEQVR